MRLCYQSMDVEVSLSKVTESKLVDEPVIVELVNEHQGICAVCPIFIGTDGNCNTFPFCDKVKVRQMTVPKYPTGAVTVDAKGRERVVYREGAPCATYGRRKFVVQQIETNIIRDTWASTETIKRTRLLAVNRSGYSGFEVIEDGEGVRIEERTPFDSSTKVLEISKADLYPAGVEDNFLTQATYEMFAKLQKDEAETLRNERKLYEIIMAWRELGVIAVKQPFVWKKGVYTSWAVTLEPMIFEDGKFLIIMKTTGATLDYEHAMNVPPVEALEESTAPKVNNLKAIGSFLEGMKPTPTIQV